MTDRPNFLFITSDQQRGDCYGFAGRRIRTPHLDRLAADGTRLSTCITPNLICQPARAAILTGMLPLSSGVHDNGVDLDPELGEAGFAGTLSKSGYHSALIGKGHFSTRATFQPTGRAECQKSSANFGPDWHGPYMGFDHVEMSLFGHIYRDRPSPRPPEGQHYERFLFDRAEEAEIDRLHQAGLAPEIDAAQTWDSALPAAWHHSTWVGDRTIANLRERKREGGPFVMWASFPDPHHPFDCPAPWCWLHDRDEVDLPEHRTRDLDRRPWWHRASLESEPQLADPALRRFRAKSSRIVPQTDDQLRHMTQNYFGMISLIDHNVGRIMAELEELGLAENTIVIYTSDHGDLLGDHGMYLKGPTPYDGLLNVGAIVKGPGVPAGKVVDEPCSTLDVAATFYDYAGAPQPDHIQSRSLRPLIEEDDATRDVAYMEWNVAAARVGVPLEIRTVRTKRYVCTFEAVSGAGELYDHQEDPHEMNNRFDDPAYAKVRKEMQDLLRARPGKIRDPLPVPIGMA